MRLEMTGEELQQVLEKHLLWKKSYGDAGERANLSHINFSRPDLSGVDLSDANLREVSLYIAKLSGANLFGASLHDAYMFRADLTDANLVNAQLPRAFLSDAILSGARLSGANLSGTNLTDADLSDAKLHSANLSDANLSNADLSNADLSGANLSRSNLSGANLSGTNLSGATLSGATLLNANLSEANLIEAALVKTDLTGSNLKGARIYGISVWSIIKDGTTQKDLIITEEGEPEITVDNLEVAQFIYLMLNNQNIRDVIDTISSKSVLILGRFTDERKPLLDALKEELRKRNYLPILFDFEGPQNRDITETISILAKMSRFVIADLTDAKSIPQELSHIIPHTPSLPVLPIILQDQREYAMFEHFKPYPWVLPLHTYATPEAMLDNIVKIVIEPAEEKVVELRGNSK